MKKKLLIVAGAGASVEFGLPSVADIDGLLSEAADKRWTLASNPDQNLYVWIRNLINAYYRSGPNPRLIRKTNFEEILFQLHTLDAHLDDYYHITCSNALLTTVPIPNILDRDSKSQRVESGMLTGLAKHLANTIIDECITRSEQASTKKQTAIAELGHFLSALSNEFEIGIVTLNYDNIVSQSYPNLFTGFNDRGIFEPETVFDREAWGFIYHLHGSIHFSTQYSDQDSLSISWQEMPLPSKHGRTSGGRRQDFIEGLEQLNSVIVAGYGKTQQILRQPFRTYFAQTQRLIHIADSILFMGYGFGDVHLNELFSDVRSRRRPCVVIDWAKDDTFCFQRRMDDWTSSVSRTLFPSDQHPSFSSESSPSKLVGEYKSARELETCLDSELPLAIWYDGLLSACQEPDKIMAHLR